MSPAPNLPAGLLETTVAHLAKLFLPGTDGDPTAARQAAAHTLHSYRPETEDEFSLAATIISSSLQALEALGQAAMPDQSLTRILRLRGGAVSLSREAEKARRRLGQLQTARRQGETQPAPAPPDTAQAKPAVKTDTRQGPGETPRPHQPTAPIRPPTDDQIQQEARIAASLKRAEAVVAARANTAAAVISPTLLGPQIPSAV